MARDDKHAHADDPDARRATTGRRRASRGVRHRGPLSLLTLRILALNILALGILAAGLLFLGDYRDGLIEAKVESTTTLAAMIAGAIGEGAAGLPDFAALDAETARLMAALERGVGNQDGVRDWLARVAAAPPPAAWRCGECAEIAAEFRALCPHCGQLGTLRWRAAERPPPALGALDSGRDDEHTKTRLAEVASERHAAGGSGASGGPLIDADRKRGVA